MCGQLAPSLIGSSGGRSPSRGGCRGGRGRRLGGSVSCPLALLRIRFETRLGSKRSLGRGPSPEPDRSQLDRVGVDPGAINPEAPGELCGVDKLHRSSSCARSSSSITRRATASTVSGSSLIRFDAIALGCRPGFPDASDHPFGGPLTWQVQLCDGVWRWRWRGVRAWLVVMRALAFGGRARVSFRPEQVGAEAHSRTQVSRPCATRRLRARRRAS